MRYVLAVLAIAGIFVSTIALRIHYSTDAPPCSITEHWDCGTVNHSRYSELGGFPVAGMGIIGYTAILLLLVFDGRSSRRLVVLAALAGLGFALYLSSIEANVLHIWCLYCVISQGIIATITLLAFIRAMGDRRLRSASN
ncbi:MAG: vitamin K epoxide reductase family protein [Acidobacteriaceae bacterium]